MRPDHLGQVTIPDDGGIELADSSWTRILQKNADPGVQMEVTYLSPINKNTATDVQMAIGYGVSVASVTDFNLRFPCHIGGGGSVNALGGAHLELPPNCSLFGKLVAFDGTALGAPLATGAGVQVNAIGYHTKG